MKNMTPLMRLYLDLSLRTRRRAEVQRVIAPYSPVGFGAGVFSGKGEPSFFFGGEAVIGEKPAAKDTIFRVASISKMFGAAAALRLVREGKLSLDGGVSETLGFSTGRPITLRQLLTHTAAINDRVYDRVLGTPDMPPLDKLLPESFFAYEPGTRFAYSNLGAGVVGMLVEAASGMLFDDFVRQTFFAPSGIDASFHPQRIVNQSRMANCYHVPGRTLAYDAYAIAASPMDEAPNPRMHYGIPAGKLMISAPDLLSLLPVLLRESGEMFVRQDHIGSVRCDAGRGLGAAYAEKGVFAADRAFWGHQGTAYGALCEAWIDPKTQTAAVLLTNGIRLGRERPLYAAGRKGVTALLDHIAPGLVY